ncbi:MAG: biopolymer transporter ExbD [Sphingomonadaceae bacterium]|nr:biopolymer transporter ExbD [Sphingomonadaceae bacterium]
MSMNIAPAEGGDGSEIPMSDINTTPLVDVMLVLLIIFLITVPVVIQTVDVELPNVRLAPTATKPENVSLSIRSGADGCEVYWNQTRVNAQELYDRAAERLESLIERAGGVENMTEDDLPEVHIRGDVRTPWRCVGGPIYMMQRAGFARVGFISEPPPGIGIQRL